LNKPHSNNTLQPPPVDLNIPKNIVANRGDPPDDDPDDNGDGYNRKRRFSNGSNKNNPFSKTDGKKFTVGGKVNRPTFDGLMGSKKAVEFLLQLKPFMKIQKISWEEMMDGQFEIMLTQEALSWFQTLDSCEVFNTYEDFHMEFMKQFVGADYSTAFHREVIERYQGKNEMLSTYVSHLLGAYRLYSPQSSVRDKITLIIRNSQNEYMVMLNNIDITDERMLINRAQEIDAIMKDRGINKVTDRSKISMLGPFMDPIIECDPRDKERQHKLQTNPSYYQQEYQRSLNKPRNKHNTVSTFTHVLPKDVDCFDRGQRSTQGFNSRGRGLPRLFGRGGFQSDNQPRQQHNPNRPADRFNASSNPNRQNTSFNNNGNRTRWHYNQNYTKMSNYQNSKNWYDNKNNQQSQQKPEQNRTMSAPRGSHNVSRGGSNSSKPAAAPSKPTLNTSKGGKVFTPKPSTPFKSQPPNRFSNHGKVFMVDDEQYVETYTKDECPDPENCTDETCGYSTDDNNEDTYLADAEDGSEDGSVSENESGAHPGSK